MDWTLMISGATPVYRQLDDENTSLEPLINWSLSTPGASPIYPKSSSKSAPFITTPLIGGVSTSVPQEMPKPTLHARFRAKVEALKIELETYVQAHEGGLDEKYCQKLGEGNSG
jgi:hypothetical protein